MRILMCGNSSGGLKPVWINLLYIHSISLQTVPGVTRTYFIVCFRKASSKTSPSIVPAISRLQTHISNLVMEYLFLYPLAMYTYPVFM